MLWEQCIWFLFQLLCRGIRQTRSMQRWRKWSVTSLVPPSGYQPRRSYERSSDHRVDTVADQPLLSDSLTAIELWHSYQIVCDKAGQGELIYKPGQAIDLFIGVYVFYCECIIIFSSSIMHFTCVTLFMCD